MVATAVQVKRQELRELVKERDERLAKLDDEDFKAEKEWVAETEAMVNACADRSDELVALERLESARAGSAGGSGKRPPADPGESPGAMNRLGVVKSLGAEFITSDAYKDWKSKAAADGHLPQGTKVANSDPLRMAELGQLIAPQSALITGASDTSAGAFVVTDRTGIYGQLGRRPLDVLDLIRRLTTDSDLVEFVRMTSRTNAAAIVAEATATSGSSGIKPESDLALVVVQTAVKTIANWLAVTRQAIADASQLRGIIDDELRDNLRETVEQLIIAGTSGIVGIMETSGTQTQAWDTNILTTTRKARTLVRTVGRATPSAYLLRPDTWEIIDLLQDNEARYFFGGPAAMGQPRLWGLPVVESESLPSGYGIVGDWSKAVLWDRQQSQILVSDSHSDFFARNLIAILAELRAAFGVIQPNAFVEIDVAA